MDNIKLNENGSVVIFASLIIFIMLILATFQIVIGFMFRDQVVVIDALDSAVTASLAPADEMIRDTYYYEKLIITDWEIIDGEQFPTEYEWVNTGCQGYAGNYILLDYLSAYNNANQYFNKYLELNKMNYDIHNFDLEIEYDDDRYLPVINARWFTSKPYEWWGYEFDDDGVFTFPNQLIYVRFPRWVKTKIDTTIEMPIPFGVGLSSLLDTDSSNFLTIKRRYVSHGIKEIKVINPPPIFGWE